MPAPHADAVFAAAFADLVGHVVGRHGVPVHVGHVAEPFKGDLDGAEIVIDLDNPVEARVFLAAHLFGHTVQWNTNAESRRLGTTVLVRPDDRTLAALEDYEREACRYSLSALHAAGIGHLDQWIADYSACDFAYLRHFYRTGERRELAGFWRDGTPLLEPLPIPAFTPRRWRRRDQAIVV